ncbi:YtxH domain-containing protein [Nocardioides speluncae]|uniref:YtxH domain-containing protein n=1 Tax=Nocardioides speluncae TaxID=2670337 RepID=UPI000D68B6BE|nr:YtxH domain-containing protein [Nocardioides speluncae]
MRKLTMLAGLAAGATGYVLGTRAGRQRFEQIKHGAEQFSQNPKVRDVAHKATEQVKHQAPVVKEKVSAAASKLPGHHGETNGTHVSDPDATWPSDSAEPFPKDPVQPRP